MSWFAAGPDGTEPIQTSALVLVDLGLVGSPGSVVVCPSLAELEDRMVSGIDRPAAPTCFAASIEPPVRGGFRSIGRQVVVRSATEVNPAAMDMIARAVGAETASQQTRPSPSPLLDRWSPSDPVVDRWRAEPMARPEHLPAWVHQMTGIRVSWRRPSATVVRDPEAVAIDVAAQPDAPALVRIDPDDPMVSALPIVQQVRPHRIRLDATDLVGLDQTTVSNVVAGCVDASRSRVVEIVGELGALDAETIRASLVGAANRGGLVSTRLVAAAVPTSDEVHDLLRLIQLDPTIAVAADAVAQAALSRHFDRRQARPWAQISVGLRQASRQAQDSLLHTTPNGHGPDGARALIVSDGLAVRPTLHRLARALSASSIVARRRDDGDLHVLGPVDAIFDESQPDRALVQIPDPSLHHCGVGAGSCRPWLIAGGDGVGICCTSRRLDWAEAAGASLSSIHRQLIEPPMNNYQHQGHHDASTAL